MELSLKILLGVVAFICLGGGASLLLKGASSFLPAPTPPPRMLDNIFRFLSGIYFSLGFFVAWVVVHLQEVTDLVYFIGIVVAFAGFGRLYSRVKVGSAGKYFDCFMIFEIALGIAIMLLQYFRG